MKRIFIFFFALSTLGYTYCNEHILSLTSELCSSKSVYLSLPRVDIEDITPFTHTIAYNLGDSILGMEYKQYTGQQPFWGLGVCSGVFTKCRFCSRCIQTDSGISRSWNHIE